jgi:hypothetical protein
MLAAFQVARFGRCRRTREARELEWGEAHGFWNLSARILEAECTDFGGVAYHGFWRRPRERAAVLRDGALLSAEVAKDVACRRRGELLSGGGGRLEFQVTLRDRSISRGACPRARALLT